ncbi:uncharacterized protein ACNLHF_021070 [Anomaloglossus baeobatrachus]|uniref:uncharacterized protein LOC142312683 n=1 Tax=Anomaloglossus baeobatrachus TaxID=238106 RepID=UPI003F4F7D56
MEGKEVWRAAAGTSVFPRSCRTIPCRTEDSGKCSRFPALLGCGFALLSVFSLALSLMVLCRTSDLQSRVSDLEKFRYTHLSALASADQMETAILGRVDQLLEEKLKSHLPRLREVRDTSVKCLCPPGPPGARGKRGQNGEPELYKGCPHSQQSKSSHLRNQNAIRDVYKIWDTTSYVLLKEEHVSSPTPFMVEEYLYISLCLDNKNVLYVLYTRYRSFLCYAN